LTDKVKNPGGAPITHGVKSKTVAARFSDLRTGRGKALHESINNLVAHFGGPEAVSSPMQILIDSAVRPKLIVLMLVSEWVDRQAELIDSAGGIPDVLGKHYLAYTNSLRRDLETLTNLAKDAGMKAKPPKIEDLIG